MGHSTIPIGIHESADTTVLTGRVNTSQNLRFESTINTPNKNQYRTFPSHILDATLNLGSGSHEAYGLPSIAQRCKQNRCNPLPVGGMRVTCALAVRFIYYYEKLVAQEYYPCMVIVMAATPSTIQSENQRSLSITLQESHIS